MDKDNLLQRLADIQSRKDAALKEYKAKIEPIDEEERLAIEEYLEANAKYKMGQKVLVNQPDRKGENWKPVYVGWRWWNTKKEWIVYRTLMIKKDGTPGGILSSRSYPEEDLRKFGG